MNQKLGSSPAARRLTPSEIALLQASKHELVQLALNPSSPGSDTSPAPLDAPVSA
jgi:hypothetical protein